VLLDLSSSVTIQVSLVVSSQQTTSISMNTSNLLQMVSWVLSFRFSLGVLSVSPVD